MATKYLGLLSFSFFCIFSIEAQVGIGTINPASSLHVMDDSTATEIRIEHPSKSVLTLKAGSPVLQWSEGTNIRARAQWVNDQLKFFSSPPQGFPISFSYPTLNLSEDRKVGINLGLIGTPTEALDVNGRIRIGYSNDQATEGTIRYDPGTKSFQGYDGGDWLGFTNSIRDKDGDNFIELIEDVNDRIRLRTPGGSLFFDGRRISMGQNDNIIIGGVPSNSNNNEYNTVLGSAAGNNMSGGRWNTFSGRQSGFNLSNGAYNSFYGTESGMFSNGSNNTYIGYKAGANNSSGSNNVFIGNRAGEQNTGSNQLIIDNRAHATPLIQGNFSSKELELNSDLIVNQLAFFNGNVLGHSAASFQASVGGSALKIHHNGSDKYDINYDPSGDKLIIKDVSNNDDVFIIENGEVTIPSLANGKTNKLRVDPNGKIFPHVNPDILEIYQYHFYQRDYDYDLYYLIPPELMEGYTKFKSMKVYRWNSNEDVHLLLFKRAKDPYVVDFRDILSIQSGGISGNGVTVVLDETPTHSIIDTAHFNYMLRITDRDDLLYFRKIELIME
jgi:hypothetical protein